MLTQALPSWKSLSLAEQVAQMIVVRASGHLFDHQIQYPAWEPPAQTLKRWLDLGMGGVILLGGSAAEVGLRTQQLQDWAKIPLLIAADIEEGVGQRFAGAVWFPPPMTLGAIAQQNLTLACDYAEQMGAITAQEALAIGLNWVLAPVVDVNNNPANPVINLRAWGETPDIVSQLTTAFIRGAQHYPVLTTAKHFPGHGDTAMDSHLELPVLQHDAARLDAVELVPFRAAIAAGVDTVMTAHLKLPLWDEAPATLSRPILTGLLRQSLQFPGLIVTDALMMGAITQHYGPNEAAVLAVAAGADVLMMPVDPVGAVGAICDAVAAGRIQATQIEAAVERIWRAKQKVAQQYLPDVETTDPHAWETPPPSIRLTQLAQPQALSLVHQMLEAALVIHRPSVHRPSVHRPFQAASQPASVAPVAHSRNLILVDDALNCTFLNRQAPAIALPQSLGYSLQVVDSYTPQTAWADLEFGPTLLQIFVRGNPFRNSAGLIELAQQWLRFLLQPQSGQPSRLQALAVYGSPYLLQQIVPQLPADLPYVFSQGQLPAAQAVALRALLGMAEPQQQIGEFTD